MLLQQISAVALRSAGSLFMVQFMNRFFGFAGALILAVHTTVGAMDIQEKAVEYKAGDVVCEGWHAVDASKPGKKPAVLIVHQWTGVSENEKMRARMLAEIGYNVFD